MAICILTYKLVSNIVYYPQSRSNSLDSLETHLINECHGGSPEDPHPYLRLSLFLSSDNTRGRTTMSDLSSSCPIRSEQVTWKALEGESVLLHLETGVYFTLNETGTAAWELFDGATSLTAIGEALCTRFDVLPEQSRQDLLELTHTLLDEGLVRIHEDHSTPSGAERS